MKQIIYLLFTVILFSACSQNQPVRYFSASPEIEITKSTLKHYVDGNWEAISNIMPTTQKS